MESQHVHVFHFPKSYSKCSMNWLQHVVPIFYPPSMDSFLVITELHGSLFLLKPVDKILSTNGVHLFDRYKNSNYERNNDS